MHLYQYCNINDIFVNIVKDEFKSLRKHTLTTTKRRVLMSIISKTAILLTVLITLNGCAMMDPPTMASPQQLSAVAPEPIEDNSGQYMLPFTSDGVLAEWVNNSVNAKLGSQVGGAVGAYAGQKLAENIPFVGSWLGQMAGETLGREVALEAAGGEEVIRETSDLSFNSLDQLAVYMYVNHSSSEHYAAALEAVMEIYPSLKQSYYQAIYTASANAGY